MPLIVSSELSVLVSESSSFPSPAGSAVSSASDESEETSPLSPSSSSSGLSFKGTGTSKEALSPVSFASSLSSSVCVLSDPASES